MRIQTITTPAGEEMVIMPRIEYERMLAATRAAQGSDGVTLATAARTLRPEDMLPPSVTALLLKGEGRVATFRNWRGLSQHQLAVLSTLPLERVLEIETGNGVLSMDDARYLGTALNVPSGWLLD